MLLLSRSCRCIGGACRLGVLAGLALGAWRIASPLCRDFVSVLGTAAFAVARMPAVTVAIAAMTSFGPIAASFWTRPRRFTLRCDRLLWDAGAAEQEAPQAH